MKMRRKIGKMNSKAKSKIIILLTLGILFALLPIITTNLSFITGNSNNSSDYSDDINLDNEYLKISAVSGKIHIDNNWTAAKAAGICTGNGTYSEPYVIEDLVIDANGSGSGILIENSDVYFKIENCTFYNSRYRGYLDAGIKLSYVNNSQLINNNCSSNWFGIFLDESNNNTVSGNAASYNNYDGIYLRNSDYNTLTGNNASYKNDYGIFLRDSDYNTISGNTANNNNQVGISITRSAYNTISGNKASNNEVGINLGNSNSNTISGNTANYNYPYDGIRLYQSNNNTISGNIANKNNFHGDEYLMILPAAGIKISNCDNNRITSNILTNNHFGINILKISKCNIISNNSFSGNIKDIQDFQEICLPLPFGIVLGIVIPIAIVAVVITGVLVRKRNKARKSRLPKDEVARYKKLKELEGKKNWKERISR